jgi:hypothetical protein
MSTALSSRRPLELVRCSNVACSHEFVRNTGAKLTLPCNECRSEMIVFPLELRIVGDKADCAFDAAMMKRTLEGAAERAELLVDEPGTNFNAALKRSHHSGRAAAYREAVEMLAVLVSADTDDGVSVGDRLRTSSEASA